MQENAYRTVNKELTVDEIKKLVNRFKSDSKKFQTLEDYYHVRNTAIEAVTKDENAPNHKMKHAYAKYITDIQTGYFMGQPVAYYADDTLLSSLENLQAIYNANDEQAENAELARTASVNGIAYELLYADENGDVRFANVSPLNTFIVYDMTLRNNIIAAIRTYTYKDATTDKDKTFIHCYENNRVRYFEGDDDAIALVAEQPHYFNDVPVVVYENNPECMGDFEPVLTQIDAYDKEQSNTLDDMDTFTDAYLMLTNMSGTDDEDVKDMRKKKILMFDDNGKAEWLIKNVNDAWVENMKTRIQNDIHKFSKTPDLTDEKFGGNLSGVSLRYKLLALEQSRATKERSFKKALKRRMKLIAEFGNGANRIQGYEDFEIRFNNFLPQNILESAQIVSLLANYLSQETLLSLLPFVDDPSEEVEKREKEKLDNASKNMQMLMDSYQVDEGESNEPNGQETASNNA